MRRIKPQHALIFGALFVTAFLCPVCAFAQSLGIGIGLGLPLMDYITEETGKEYRITPKPGYYPILQTRENALGSVHFNASLLLDFELPVDIEIRFDAARLTWKKRKITHVTCTPVDVINGHFDDSIADYIPLDKADSQCINKNTYKSSTDISKKDLSSLWFFHISGGARYAFYESEIFQAFAGAHLGLTIGTTIDSDSWFGGNIDAMIGIMVRLSDLIWLELDARILFLLTEAPANSQVRVNHETQIGGNIFTSLVQPDAYVDFQLSIRFDFTAL